MKRRYDEFGATMGTSAEARTVAFTIVVYALP
jgi:hypothetical protein